MAERRMFAKSIVLSDAFLDMPMSARCLYFTLGMCAQEKGHLYNAFSIAKSIGSEKSDVFTLLDRGFLQEVDDGFYITDWCENNNIGATAKKRNNYQYRQWRLRILKRDKCCQQCGNMDDLEVHHIKHFSEYPELRTDDNNGIVLCRKCHRNLHRSKKNGEKKNV